MGDFDNKQKFSIDKFGNRVLKKSHDFIEFTKAKEPYKFRSISFRTIVLSSFASLFLMIIIAIISFFLIITPKDETVIPSVESKSLIEALLLLQENNLNTHIVSQFSEEVPEGQIIRQTPESGIFVKMDSTIDLLVSQGKPKPKIESFVGLSLDDVKERVLTSYAGSLTLKDPVSYAFDNAPVGTVLAQKPEADADLIGSMQLELIVSRGITIKDAPVSSYLGINYLQAMQLVGKLGKPFKFIIKNATSDELNNYITAQNPKAGNTLRNNNALELTISYKADANQTETLEVFDFDIPVNDEESTYQVILRRTNFPDSEIFRTTASDIAISIPCLVVPSDEILLVNGDTIVKNIEYRFNEAKEDKAEEIVSTEENETTD